MPSDAARPSHRPRAERHATPPPPPPPPPRPAARPPPPPAYSRRPSSDRRRSLRSRPPVYPPSAPPVRSTLWHGTTIGIGLAPSALPAARTARSLPAASAMSRYDAVAPNG